MIKVIVTDDHPIIRKGLKQIIDECPDIEVVDEASCGSELIAKMRINDYDVALLDISMPGRSGIEVLKDAKKLKPNMAILMLSVYAEEHYALRTFKLGASGYLSKDSIPDDLVSAIRKVSEGGKYITSSLAEKIAFEFDAFSSKPIYKFLSNREFEVMCYFAKGCTISIIAKKLTLSSKTISTYRERILQKLKLKNTSEIIRYALKEGLVD